MASDLTDHNVVVVDNDEDFLDQAKRLFDGEVTLARSVADVQRSVESGAVDLVILGPSNAHEAGLEGFGLLLEIDPALPIVLVAGTITAPLLKAALRIGLRDVLEAPLTESSVREVLTSVGRRSTTAAAVPAPAELPPVSQGKVVAVVSAKGGSGKTVTAVNLAMLVGQMHDPERVVIVDADLQFGDVCLVLQLEPRHTVVNAAQDIERLDDSMLESMLTRHPSGLRVLAAPLEPVFADEITNSAMVQLVEQLRNRFDYVIVDTASSLDELLLSLLERADQVLFVVDMDLPSVKNAKLALETLRLLKYPSSKIRLVLNRSNAKARLDEGQIEESLKMKIAASVPSDGLVPASVNEGRPVVETAPRSKVARGFESVAKLVVGGTSSSSDGKRRWR